MIQSMYDVSVQFTGQLPAEMQFINAIITLILCVIPLISLIAIFVIPYMLAGNHRMRW